MRWPRRDRPQDRSGTGEARDSPVPKRPLPGPPPPVAARPGQPVTETSPETACRNAGRLRNVNAAGVSQRSQTRRSPTRRGWQSRPLGWVSARRSSSSERRRPASGACAAACLSYLDVTAARRQWWPPAPMAAYGAGNIRRIVLWLARSGPNYCCFFLCSRAARPTAVDAGPVPHGRRLRCCRRVTAAVQIAGRVAGVMTGRAAPGWRAGWPGLPAG
jgi:hypothetical protein